MHRQRLHAFSVKLNILRAADWSAYVVLQGVGVHGQ